MAEFDRFQMVKFNGHSPSEAIPIFISKPFSMKYLSLMLLFLAACFSQPKPGADGSPKPVSGKKPIIIGAEQMDKLLPLIRGKSIALVVNQTSLVNGVFLADTLLARSGPEWETRIEIKKFFALEHGIRGDEDAGATISSGSTCFMRRPLVLVNRIPMMRQLFNGVHQAIQLPR